MSRRIRTIKGEFFSDEKIGRLPMGARYLYLGLITLADDSGRLKLSHRMIWGEVFPYDDDVSIRDVREWLARLSREGRIIAYRVAGETYLQIRHWARHQKVDRPSKTGQCPEYCPSLAVDINTLEPLPIGIVEPLETAQAKPSEALATDSRDTREVASMDMDMDMDMDTDARAHVREGVTPDAPPTRPRLLPSMAPDVPPAEAQIDPEPMMDLRSASDMLSRGPGESMAAREAHRLYGEVYVPACREASKTPPKWSRAQIITPFVRLVLFAHRQAPDDPDAARRMLAHAVTEEWRTWNGADKLLEPGAILADGKLDSLLASSGDGTALAAERVRGRTRGPDGVMYQQTCAADRYFLRDEASGQRLFEWVGGRADGEWRAIA